MNLKSKKVFSLSYKHLESRWDVKFYNSKLISKYELIPLADIISERSEKVKLNKYPENIFKVLKVSNKAGITCAYEEKGKNFNQSYKKVYSGDIVYNPYRVNIGSIGVVPKEYDGSYVSPAYVVFSIKENKYDPYLLNFILKADWYNNQIRSITSGSVRQNLTFELLTLLKVPKIPEKVQDELIENFNEQKAYIEKANRIKKDIIDISDKRLFKILGIKYEEKNDNIKVISQSWSNLERWGVRYNKNKAKGFDISNGYYKLVPLESIIEKIQYGTSDKASENIEGIPVIRMNNIKNRFMDLENLKYINNNNKKIENLLLEKGDILIIRTNGSRSLVGTCAVFEEEEKYIFASYLIRIRLNHKIANPKFVSWFLNSKLGREQIELLSRQIMQNNINSEEIKEILIPLPEYSIQEKIVSMIEIQTRRKLYIEKLIENKNIELQKYMKEMLIG